MLAQQNTRSFGAIVKADGDHKFIASTDKKYLAFNGMRATSNQMISLDNHYRHQNNEGLLNHVHVFSSYAHGHTFEEELSIHDEPYGYATGDDPFDPHGQGDYVYLVIFSMGVSFIHFAHSHFRFDRRKIGEVFYHQRLVANQLDDKIRAARL